MRKALQRIIVAAGVAGAIWLSLAWPHLNRVETGRTPEYPDLIPRDYGAGEAQVTRALLATIPHLGWTTVGSGSGPGGAEVRAVARASFLRIPTDIVIRVRPQAGRSSVSVTSESHYGPWDLGQNARAVRTLLNELDRRVK